MRFFAKKSTWLPKEIGSDEDTMVDHLFDHGDQRRLRNFSCSVDILLSALSGKRESILGPEGNAVIDPRTDRPKYILIPPRKTSPQFKAAFNALGLFLVHGGELGADGATFKLIRNFKRMAQTEFSNHPRLLKLSKRVALTAIEFLKTKESPREEAPVCAVTKKTS